ncbi:Dyp-type peroxidase [Secundilactobacillus paracollinoides]|uniref:Peroxidase n=1 Tax=Secundilactobacillus paracollinoides TaxID=240427 RepID=A0A1B2IUY3_9LACO|nr:Dyp-type peroxidase [Secundilactobacillus paracollinoides]ANZ60048.1 peroxidase [Secundilactobacillus paracollinoides]ANZ65841.1 peroxidase [Secundilactobacillus paracollinoides]
MTIDLTDTQAVYKDAGQYIEFTTLLLNRKDRDAELAAVQDFAGNYQSILNSMNIRYPDAKLAVAFGFSNAAWTYLFPNADKPKQLVDFEPVKGPKYTAPATPGDLFFHVRAVNEAVVYEIMDQFSEFFRDVTSVVDETHGFRYFEGRAIVGFIDGTENPSTQQAPEYAVIGDEDPKFIDGSYAFAQKYTHDMDAWKALPTEEQEKTIGRKKFSDRELADEEKSPNAHNIVAQDNKDGIEHKIVRMNVPFSDPAKNVTGTYFIGYAREYAIIRRMLEGMFTNSDRLLDYSTPINGNMYFIPSLSLVDDIADDAL